MFPFCMITNITYTDPCIFSSTDHSFQEEINPAAEEVNVLEGNSVKLSCTYTGVANILFWYRQYSRSKPEFLIFVASTDRTEGQFTAKHDRNNKETALEISSAKVTDSALYYCALQPTVTGNPETLHKNFKLNFSTVQSLNHPVAFNFSEELYIKRFYYILEWPVWFVITQ